MAHKHTPGPWEYDNTKRYYPKDVVRRNGLLVVTRARDGSDADMRLIAAAPALLAACEAAEEYFRDADAPMAEILRAAIARATDGDFNVQNLPR